jgi:hypothetical protein
MKKLQVRYQEPPKGRRQYLCRGDEALVRRIISGSHDGLVERIQELGPQRRSNEISTFQLFCRGNSDSVSLFGSTELSYHLLKFLALGMAHCLCPDYVVEPHELRAYRRHGRKYVATYSSFVPDETGVIERRERIMKRYYSLASDNAREQLRAKADEEEWKLIEPFQHGFISLLRSGLDVAHPTANYHVSNGKMVLFEIDSLDMEKALTLSVRASVTTGPEQERYTEGLAYLSTIYSIALKAWALRAFLSRAHSRDFSGPTHDVVMERDFNEMFLDLYSLFETSSPFSLIGGFVGMGYHALACNLYNDVAELRERRGDIQRSEPICEFDEIFLEFLEFGGLRRQPNISDFFIC